MTLTVVLEILGVLGAIDLGFRGLGTIGVLLPRTLSWNARLWHTISQHTTIRSLRNKAISSQIDEVLNQTVFELQPYLPKGWLKRARVEWVGSHGPSHFRDGQIIVRIKPSNNSDHNLMRSLWAYFSTSIFPLTQEILPRDFVSAVALAVARTGIEKSHQYLLDEFDKSFLNTAADHDDPIWEYFADCVRLNDYGLLLGPLLREIDAAASSIRFRAERVRISDHIRGVITHMLSFQPFLMGNKRERDWIYQSSSWSYAFILVSRPPETRPAIESYVRRAETDVQCGIDRLYILGRGDEREFVQDVIRATTSVRGLKGIDIFQLYRDYRGEVNGIGAMFSRDQLVARLNLDNRDLPLLIDQLHEKRDAESSKTISIPGGLVDIPRTMDQVAGAGSEDMHADTGGSDAEESLKGVIEDVLSYLSDFDGQWVPLTSFGAEFRKRIPDFHAPDFGARNLFSVLKRFEWLELHDDSANGTRVISVRKNTTGPASNNLATSPEEIVIHNRIVNVLRERQGVDGWVFLGVLGQFYKRYYGEIAYSDFGVASLREFIDRIVNLEIQERGPGHSKTYVRVRR